MDKLFCSKIKFAAYRLSVIFSSLLLTLLDDGGGGIVKSKTCFPDFVVDGVAVFGKHLHIRLQEKPLGIIQLGEVLVEYLGRKSIIENDVFVMSVFKRLLDAHQYHLVAVVSSDVV